MSNLEPSHDQWHHHVPLLLSHLGGDSQQHQHVIALCHTHSIQVRQHVSTGNLALHVGIFNQGIEEVCGLDKGETTVSEGGDAGIHPNTNPERGKDDSTPLRIKQLSLPWNRDVHEVRTMFLLVLIIL